MDTVRTSGKFEDYFLDKCEGYALKKDKHLVTGHIHYDRQTKHFDNLASAGYQGDYYLYKDSEMGTILVIADLHFGIKGNELEISDLLKRASRETANMVVFLGDTFDMALTNNNYIVTDPLFKKLDVMFKSMPTVLVYGNHDINLKGSSLDFIYKLTNEINLRKYLLNEYNLDIVEEFETKDLVFIHGHQFDVNVYKFKGLYLLAFALSDFINPTIAVIDKILKKFNLGKR